MRGFLERVRERKLVQWALDYVAATFAPVSLLDATALRAAAFLAEKTQSSLPVPR